MPDGIEPERGSGQTKQATPLILLDLNYTLVENSRESMRGPTAHDVAKERYRTWLVDLMRDRYVILITARLESYRDETLAHIDALTGWRPQEAWFKEQRLQQAPDWKEEALHRFVFPQHGEPVATKYLALESNDDTARMYARYRIPRLCQQDLQRDPWLLEAAR